MENISQQSVLDRLAVWRKQCWDNSMVERELLVMLLERYENLLGQELCQDGDDLTAFTRGWLARPMHVKWNPANYYAMEYQEGVEARKKAVDLGMQDDS